MLHLHFNHKHSRKAKQEIYDGFVSLHSKCIMHFQNLQIKQHAKFGSPRPQYGSRQEAFKLNMLPDKKLLKIFNIFQFLTTGVGQFITPGIYVEDFLKRSIT